MNAGTKLSLILLAVPQAVTGQSFLEQFSYDGLRFSGIGIETARVWSDRLSPEWSGGLRVDYGLIAPRVRVMLGASYFKGQLKAQEVAEFEASLGRVVTDPTNDATIDVGQIDWATFEGVVDLHYLFPSQGRVLAYTGLGLGVQLWNGSGAAIDGTFVEDALDTIVAGLAASAGLEIALTSNVFTTVEGRGGLTSELRTASLRLGLLYRFVSSRVGS